MPEMMPDSTAASVTSSAVPSPVPTPKPLSERHATPFRELTEEEAMEMARLSSNEGKHSSVRRAAGGATGTRSSTRRR